MALQVDYKKLEKDFALLPFPYVTITEVLRTEHKKLLSNIGISGKEKQIAPPDFTILSRNSDGTPYFRWILGYDQNKFRRILENKQVFVENVDLVYSRTEQSNLDLHCKEKIQEKNCSNLEFLKAVFHLTYSFRVPNIFNTAIIHELHSETKHKTDHLGQKLYHARMCVTDFDQAGVPKLQVNNKIPKPQVPPELYSSVYHPDKRFYEDWMGTIQGIFIRKSFSYKFVSHIYLPVYEYFDMQSKDLTGYVRITFRKETLRDAIAEYLKKNGLRIQQTLNSAYRDGVRKIVIEDYEKSARNSAFLIKNWVEYLKFLFGWNEIELRQETNPKQLFWQEGVVWKISIAMALNRENVPSHIKNSILDRHKEQVLCLIPPSDVPMLPNSGDIAAIFYGEKVSSMIRLLDDLIKLTKVIRSPKIFISYAREDAKTALKVYIYLNNHGLDPWLDSEKTSAWS